MEPANPSGSSNTRLRYSPLHPNARRQDHIIVRRESDSDLISFGKYEQLMQRHISQGESLELKMIAEGDIADE